MKMEVTLKFLQYFLGVGEQQLRNWRVKLGPTRTKDGRKGALDGVDMVALCVVKILIRDVGLPIGVVSSWGNEIWALCRSHGWNSLRGCHMFFVLNPKGVYVAPDVAPILGQDACIAIRLGPIIERMERSVVESLKGGQLEFKELEPPDR